MCWGGGGDNGPSSKITVLVNAMHQNCPVFYHLLFSLISNIFYI